MRKVIVTEWMSLDGVVQAPAARERDCAQRRAAAFTGGPP